MMSSFISVILLLIFTVNAHSDCHAKEVINTNQRNVETVKSIYAAFGKGDVETIISKLADDVVWGYERSTDRLETSREYRGKESVRRFFVSAKKDKEYVRLEPHSFAVGEDIVSNLVSVELKYTKTGKAASGTEAHHWKFNPQGQLIRYLAFNDELQRRNVIEYGVTQYEVEALARTWFKHFDLRQLELLADHVTPTYSAIGFAPKPLNFVEWKKSVQDIYDGFPDGRFIVDEVLATSTDFAVYNRGVGKHTGTYMGIPPTNKSVTVTAFCHFSLEKLKVAQVKCVIDMMGLLSQLGKI